MHLMQLFPLNFHSRCEDHTHVRTSSARLLQRTVQCDSFGTVEDAVPHWPRLDVCRPRLAKNLNSRRLRCWKYIGGKSSRRRPGLWSKGTVSGSVLSSGRRGCTDRQMMFSLFTAATLLCYAFPQVYKRQEENRFPSFRAIAQDNENNQTTVS